MSKRTRTDHDRLFKELLATFLREFLELFAPELHARLDESQIDFLDKEIFTDVTTGGRHIVDLLARVRLRGDPAMLLVHLESQAKAQATFARRMFQLFARLETKHHLPVYPIAVFSYTAPARRESDRYELLLPGLDVLRFRFRVVQLNRLSWRTFLRRENPVAAALMARMRVAQRDRPRVKAECLRMIVTLRLDSARVKLVSGFVDTYLRLDARETTLFEKHVGAEAPAVQEQIMEIVTSWEEKGIRKGRAEGRAEGMLAVVMDLLAKRVGPLPASTDARVRGLSARRLQALAVALLDLKSAQDIESWLDTHGTRKRKR